jgi:hypothetical protein
LPGHIAGEISTADHHSRDFLADLLSHRQLVVVLVCAALFLFFLGGPVLGEILLGLLGAVGARVAPGTVLVGLGVLLTGLVIGVRILDVIGACLIGAVLLGAILIYY